MRMKMLSNLIRHTIHDLHTHQSKPEKTACPECGGEISQCDLVCPHCGISLVSG